MPSARAEEINCRSALSDRKLIPDDQVRIFCEILQFRREYGESPATEEGRQIYHNRLRSLLPKLKFPVSSNPGFAWKLVLPKQSEYTTLCDLHKGLNADFVHQWFKYLALEVGARLEVLRSSHRDFVGGYTWDNIVKPLTRLHRLWETSSRVNEAFGDFVETGFQEATDLIPAQRQRDGCEACILARIGSHLPTLFALRATVKSRITLESSAKHPSRLRLLRLIEPWIELCQARYDNKSSRAEARYQQICDNTRLADDMYTKRKRIEIFLHEAKSAARLQPNSSTSASKHYTEPAGRDDRTRDFIYEAEHDIIDSYDALRASQRESQSLKAQALQQVRNQSATTLIGERSPYDPKGDPAYHDSRYSIDTVRNNQRVVSGPSAAAADLEARAGPIRPDSVQTCWGDVIGYGSCTGNPFTSTASPLAGIPEEHTDNHVSGQRGGVHKSIRREVPPVKLRAHDTRSTQPPHTYGLRLKESRDMFDYKSYNIDDAPKYRTSDVGSITSSISKMSMQDRCYTRSPVSSVSNYSEWTDITVQDMADARLSRPFEQPAYERVVRDSFRRKTYREI